MNCADKLVITDTLVFVADYLYIYDWGAIHNPYEVDRCSEIDYDGEACMRRILPSLLQTTYQERLSSAGYSSKLLGNSHVLRFSDSEAVRLYRGTFAIPQVRS